MSGVGRDKCGAGFQPACPRTATAAGGVTLVEMLAVVTIVIMLTGFIVSGFVNAERTQRLGKATDRVSTALNIAKNAAITHNGVAFLEIINDSAGKQLLKVHVFPNPADALHITGEPAANTMGPNQYSNTPTQVEVLAPNAWSPSKTPGYIDPASVAYQDSAPTVPIPGSGQAYNNFLTDTLTLEAGLYVGLDPQTVTSATGILI